MISVTCAVNVILIAAAVPVLSEPPSESPYGAAVPGISGQVRTRTEWDGKALGDQSANQAFLFTHIRSRLGYTAVDPDGFTYRFEAQDSRLMGSEPATANPAAASVGNAKGLDLLQAYAKYANGGFAGTLGRQKLSLGSGRFLSTLEWSPVSRAFDGLSFNWSRPTGSLTGLAFLVRDSADRAVDDRLNLTGLFYNHAWSANLGTDAYLFYDQARIASVYSGLAARNYDLVYAGGRVAGKVAMVAYEGEFIWQAGELHAARELTSEAFQMAVRAGLTSASGKVNAGLDIMSGDDDPADDVSTAYRANYWFAHAYYGWMDYFLLNPAQGVMDLRLDGEFGIPAMARSKLRAQYHWFMPHESAGGSDDAYGQEIDMEMQIGLGGKSMLLVGGGLFLPGDAASSLPAAALGPNIDSQPGFLFYCMPTFNF